MNKTAANLQQLLVYRNILHDDLIHSLLTPKTVSDNYKLAYEYLNRAELLGLEGDVLSSYFIYLISRDDNIFSRTAENMSTAIGSSLLQAVTHDITIIKNFLNDNLNSLLPIDLLTNFTPTSRVYEPDLQDLHTCFLTPAADWEPQQTVNKLAQYYARHGYGKMSNYSFFRWDALEGLVGIKHHDPITLEDIVGYERQKQSLIKNTEAFLAGKPCHNVLLVGARGTGKSSSAKAIANKYYASGLRLVEVPKHCLTEIPRLLQSLRKIGKKFILFLDDLSFEETELEYKYLKSTLEGGVELKPDNVLIYATSNRRHLVRETWSDRTDNSDDIHRFDTVHEKLSLADRFGMTLTFLTPSQEEYFTIVEEVAKKKKLPFDHAKLRVEALQWEMLHSGRSGRTAQQFIAHLLGLCQ